MDQKQKNNHLSNLKRKIEQKPLYLFYNSILIAKVGCVISSEFHVGQYREDDHWEDAPHFMTCQWSHFYKLIQWQWLWVIHDHFTSKCSKAWPAHSAHPRTNRDDRSVRGSWVKQILIRFRRPRRRQRSSNTSTKKTYDNLDDLIADINTGRVTEIDFSTFRNIHESSHFSDI